jgi:hypothetical protein
MIEKILVFILEKELLSFIELKTVKIITNVCGEE